MDKKIKTDFTTLERRAKILDLIELQGKVTVVELSKTYNISEVSVRNDLSHLEKKGLLIRTRGGAIKSQPINLELSLFQKIKTHHIEKKRIGKKSAEYVKEGYSIILDSGSTSLEVAKNLKGIKNIKIITNSLPIADICADNEGVEIIIPGGELRADMRSIVGSMAEHNIKQFSCDIAFIGANSISIKDGIYTSMIKEAAINRAMISIARKVILVIDSSKFDKQSLVKICGLEKIDVIITDKEITDKNIAQLKNLNIRLVVV